MTIQLSYFLDNVDNFPQSELTFATLFSQKTKQMRIPQCRVQIRILTVFVFTTLCFLLGAPVDANAQDGKALFSANCASCHHPLKDGTGPALKGVDGRVPNQEWLYKWIKNSAAVIASGDKYAVNLYNEWNKTAMTAFPNLKNEEIDAIIAYVNSVEPKVASGGGGGDVADKSAGGGGDTWLYALLTIVLLLAAIILSQINKMLGKNANDKLGLPTKESIPFYRNKVYIALAAILCFIGIGVYLSKGGVNMGRQQGYMPEQPIYYSHKVHAGINKINCQYCHSAAEKSRHAMVPSTNVCMNCHKQINEYTGAEEHPLYTAEGKEVNGTAEIQKLYEYAGWNAEKKDYNRDAEGNILAKAIPWVKIHNLPDHVYFNHSVHVVSGKVACQQCHGNIEEMDEVKQSEELSMGWCINCHRETNVQFADNHYYSIFEKYHQEIKEGKRENVKVSDIGGLECQKCHY